MNLFMDYSVDAYALLVASSAGAAPQGISQGTHHITSHGEDGCRPQWPLYPRNKYLYTTLLLTSI